MRNRYRALWISDVPLGSSDCEPCRLVGFLAQNCVDRVYLAGDIFDRQAPSLKRGAWCRMPTPSNLLAEVVVA